MTWNSFTVREIADRLNDRLSTPHRRALAAAMYRCADALKTIERVEANKDDVSDEVAAIEAAVSDADLVAATLEAARVAIAAANAAYDRLEGR